MSRRRKPVRKTPAQLSHELWLRRRGLHPDQLKAKRSDGIKPAEDPPAYYRQPDLPRTSDGVDNGFVGGVMAGLHKEAPEVQAEIMRKAQRVETPYSKGALQYITPGTDLTMIGSKSRRGN